MQVGAPERPVRSRRLPCRCVVVARERPAVPWKSRPCDSPCAASRHHRRRGGILPKILDHLIGYSDWAEIACIYLVLSPDARMNAHFTPRSSESHTANACESAPPQHRRARLPVPQLPGNVVKFSDIVAKSCQFPVVSIFVQLNSLGILTVSELFDMSVAARLRARRTTRP